MTTDSLNS